MRLCTLALLFFATFLVGPDAFAQVKTLNEQLVEEDPTVLATQARRDGDIVRGAILFHQGNINCAKCHRANADKDRIGPDLSRIDKDVTDEYIVESILQPSKTIKKEYESFLILTEAGLTISGIKVSENENEIVIRERDNVDKLMTVPRVEIDEIRASKISNMPANLANELKDRQQFLDLLKYVLDIKQRGPDANADAVQTVARRELSKELTGLIHLQYQNCTACHRSDSLKAPVAAKQAPRLKWSASHLKPEYIQSFIANPHAVKPGTSMPELFGDLSDEEKEKAATAITQFLLSKTQNDYQPPKIDDEAMHLGHSLFHSTGCVACHSPRNEMAEEQPLVDSVPLGDLSQKYDIKGLTEFLKDPLAVRPSGHMPNMELSHREAVGISNFLLQGAREKAITLEIDGELVKQGEALFAKSNCANCHTEITGDEQNANHLALEGLHPDRGCLSGKTGAWPNFHLTDSNRESLQAALQQLPVDLTDKQKIQVTLTAFNCINCHSRDDLGGITSDRNPHFQTTDLNLGDQGRIPPGLTGVGAKLKPNWMRDVLVNGKSIRPYMKTRMPQFGESNIGHLVQLFSANDKLPNTKFAPFEDQKAMRTKGHVLAGNQGLNCVACHTYQYKPSDTMPAVDLTEMTDRLKKDWFYQYMLDPQKFSPNTVMPSFWPGGQAIRTDLGGTSGDQVEALWQYLIDGRQARAPRGVVSEPLEIVVADEAKMLRRQYASVGKRGIGVGYPGGVNVVFDAEQLRLAMIWRGKFVEAGGVWRGQGHGNVKPLGEPFEFAKGPDLDDSAQPWVADDNRPPKHHFKGYMLDKSQRPTFLYQFDAINVEDFCEQIKDDSANQILLRRTITVTSPQQRGGLRFRIANAAEIIEKDGLFSIDKQLIARVVSKHEPAIVESGDGKQLAVLLTLAPNEKQELVIEYLWK